MEQIAPKHVDTLMSNVDPESEEKIAKILAIYHESKKRYQPVTYTTNPEQKIAAFCKKLQDEVSQTLIKQSIELCKFKKQATFKQNVMPARFLNQSLVNVPTDKRHAKYHSTLVSQPEQNKPFSIFNYQKTTKKGSHVSVQGNKTQTGRKRRNIRGYTNPSSAKDKNKTLSLGMKKTF